jgi:hypothetical protein
MFGDKPLEVARRKTRPDKRLFRRSKVKTPEGLNRQRQWRLQIISLALPNQGPIKQTSSQSL